jgi:DNA-binding transcriptional MerR regulator
MKSEPALPIGEVSRRTGLSERALRHYEAEGLISPARSAGGRRFYMARDLNRLQQVIVLRRAGYALSAIGVMMSQRELDPDSAIDLHLNALRAERDSLSRSIELLEGARTRLQTAGPLDLAMLCDLIKLAECSIGESAWKQVLDRYWSPQEIERWQQVATDVFKGDACEVMQRDWASLTARIEQLIADGVAPDSPPGLAAALDWMALQQPLSEAFAEFWPQMAKMYQEMDQWSHLAKSPFSKAVYDFAVLAVAAGREKGVIPPRKT